MYKMSAPYYPSRILVGGFEVQLVAEEREWLHAFFDNSGIDVRPTRGLHAEKRYC